MPRMPKVICKGVMSALPILCIYLCKPSVCDENIKNIFKKAKTLIKTPISVRVFV
jgi:hypothetical protein